MGWFTKLFGGAGEGAAKAVTKTVEGVNEVVERWKPSDAAKFEQAMQTEEQTQRHIANARSYDPRSSGGGIIGEFCNVMVDVASRSIRPGVTILLLGACFGWWSLPPPNSIPEIYFMWTQSVVAFWFGARTVVKDIPALILSLRKK